VAVILLLYAAEGTFRFCQNRTEIRIQNPRFIRLYITSVKSMSYFVMINLRPLVAAVGYMLGL
jgi:hypothetical protein